MLLHTLSFLTAAILLGAPADDVQPRTVLAYRGTVRLRQVDGQASPEKQFDLTLLVADSTEQATDVYWLVEETGRGAWPWIERFGRHSADAHGREPDDRGPSLLYELDEDTAVIPLVVPLLRPPVALAADASWTADRLTYTVTGAGEVDGRATWEIQVNNAYGSKRRVSLAQDSSAVLAVTERVFMNMGTEYELSLRLVGSEQLSAERFEAEQRAFDTLVDLRQALNRAARTEHTAWSESQLALLAERLPAAMEAAKSTRLAQTAEAGKRDVERQNDRAGSVEKLVEKFKGQPTDDFTVEGLDRTRTYSKDMARKLTLLHFWDYRDAPLKEPYGQVGYLEFLHERHKERGLSVYGVAVDARLADPQTRNDAIRGVRKLKQFMNLTYPVLLDGGSLVRQFGDPRNAGAELPLYVLIDGQGHIVEYHVGHYEVDRDTGLKELDAAVSRILASGK